MSFAEKKIAVGVTGGIACYKACELVRELRKSGAEVRVVMTESARRFVSDLTFSTLSENPVGVSLFEAPDASGISHIQLARWCDVFLICPGTANSIGTLAAGQANDLLSTTVLATRAPVLICPAMNSTMWHNPMVQENVSRLKRHGYQFVDPEEGLFATRAEGEGWGRLADLSVILLHLERVLRNNHDLQGKRVLVTAGPTVERIDPVRFLSNHSTGKMGFALARESWLRGAEVTLIAGPNQLPRLPGVAYREVVSAAEMHDDVQRHYSDCDILIMAAAVADYSPEVTLPSKLKKQGDALTLRMKKNHDILAGLAKKKGSRLHIGFALETEREKANALEKLRQKKLDLIVVNNPLVDGAAFAADTNVVTMITADGATEELPKLTKPQVAEKILDRICKLGKKDHQEVVLV